MRSDHRVSIETSITRPMSRVWITHGTLVNALGAGLDSIEEALLLGKTALRPCDFPNAPADIWIGRVEALENRPVVDQLKCFDSRNNRLAQYALEQDDFIYSVRYVCNQYGSERVGIIFGTSTSGILESEECYRDRDPETGALPSNFQYQTKHNNFAGAEFIRQFLDINGPCMVISTACSSSAKVFASAARWLSSGACDAVVVGGVDSLCLTTLYGFLSLGLMSTSPCRPFDLSRSGISIGEGAGFAILEKRPKSVDDVALIGYGESSDAYHMSTPHPEGLGAIRAMSIALERSGSSPESVDYVLLHGTGTEANDRTEDLAVTHVFGKKTPCSSVKGSMGHTLGAAGITNALLATLCIKKNYLPPCIQTTEVDPCFTSNILINPMHTKVSKVMSNAFGFGGSNTSLLFSKAEA